MQVRVLARFYFIYFKGSEEQRSKGSKLKIKLCVFVPSWHKKKYNPNEGVSSIGRAFPTKGEGCRFESFAHLYFFLEIKGTKILWAIFLSCDETTVTEFKGI